jgi:hypothetical protein
MREKLMRIHRLIASAVFAATIAVSGASYAFETTSIGGVDTSSGSKLLEPTEQDLNKSLGGFQFDVKTSSGADQGDDGRPPWELKPTTPMRGFSTMGGPSLFRPGQ